MKKLIRPLDIILIAVLLLGGIGFHLYTKHTTHGATAVIYIDGEIYESIELEKVEESYELTLPCSPEATLLVENGCVSFIKADCPDGLCVSTGKLRYKGDTAACLPAKTVVTIENTGESEIDVLVY